MKVSYEEFKKIRTKFTEDALYKRIVFERVSERMINKKQIENFGYKIIDE